MPRLLVCIIWMLLASLAPFLRNHLSDTLGIHDINHLVPCLCGFAKDSGCLDSLLHSVVPLVVLCFEVEEQAHHISVCQRQECWLPLNKIYRDLALQ